MHQYPGAEGTLGEKTQPDSQRVGADRTTLLPAAGTGHHCMYFINQELKVWLRIYTVLTKGLKKTFRFAV